MNKLIVFNECVYLASEIIYIGIFDPDVDDETPSWGIQIQQRGFSLDDENHAWFENTKEERDARYKQLIKDWERAIQ